MTFDEFAEQLALYLPLDRTEITPASLLHAEGIDSLALLEVLLLMEELAAREIPWDLFMSIDTFGEAHEWVAVATEGAPQG